MGGANTGGGAGGNTGADAGFFVSEQKKKEKINESGYGPDYQGEINNQYSKEKTKKTTNTYNDGNGNGGEGNNTIVNKTVGGTKIQTTEAKVEKAADLTAEQILLRNKKRGRASSIMTSSQGVGKTSSNYELGKTSLLGRV